VLGKMPTQNGKAVISIDGKRTINGKSYYKQHWVYSGLDWDNEVRYLRRGKEGIYCLYGQEALGVDKVKPELVTECLLIPLAMGVGKTWDEREANGDMLQYKAEAVETVTVGGKTYPGCLKITSKWSSKAPFVESNEETVRYMAPKVGMVKFV